MYRISYTTASWMKKILVDKQYPADKRICLSNNKGATYANLDAGNNFKNINRDISTVTCK